MGASVVTCLVTREASSWPNTAKPTTGGSSFVSNTHGDARRDCIVMNEYRYETGRLIATVMVSVQSTIVVKPDRITGSWPQVEAKCIIVDKDGKVK